jgi:hypothetical protein
MRMSGEREGQAGGGARGLTRRARRRGRPGRGAEHRQPLRRVLPRLPPRRPAAARRRGLGRAGGAAGGRDALRRPPLGRRRPRPGRGPCPAAPRPMPTRPASPRSVLRDPTVPGLILFAGGWMGWSGGAGVWAGGLDGRRGAGPRRTCGSRSGPSPTTRATCPPPSTRSEDVPPGPRRRWPGRTGPAGFSDARRRRRAAVGTGRPRAGCQGPRAWCSVRGGGG